MWQVITALESIDQVKSLSPNDQKIVKALKLISEGWFL